LAKPLWIGYPPENQESGQPAVVAERCGKNRGAKHAMDGFYHPWIRIEATDGTIGSVDDFLFSDESAGPWSIPATGFPAGKSCCRQTS